MSISNLSSAVDFEENLFEAFNKNAPHPTRREKFNFGEYFWRRRIHIASHKSFVRVGCAGAATFIPCRDGFLLRKEQKAFQQPKCPLSALWSL
jgi:hypothetical protein